MPYSSKTNHLAQETSPYLQQHAHNPVDWYPWGHEALGKARRDNKPILLSIGYAACHWCHVMAHESFEDEETAKLMNELFVNIKVDREERPDLDKIYQTAHYLLTQHSGGWPLTIFLTPDNHTPFFSGTYFPKEARYQLPAFKDILKGIADIYLNRQIEIKQQNENLVKALHRQRPLISDVRLSNQPLLLATGLIKNNYDNIYGGFGGAPKFPHPTLLEYLLRNDSTMTLDTLRYMANGGIYDQLGGGFYRYAVDVKWEIPHFEKMLYDNGQLLYLYSLAAKQYDEPFFIEIARETADWVISNMQSPEGGYYSSVDADSEGEEGKFYVWDVSEIEKLLDRKEYYIARLYFGLDQHPNFENHWHLHAAQSLESISTDLKIPLHEAQKLLQSTKEKLLLARNKRISPCCDEKILTSWNSLMIKGMLTTGDILQEPRFIKSAQSAISFIQQKLWHNNRLMASYKDGRANLPAYLDDYAFLLDALLVSLQISWDADHLHFAIDLTEVLLKYFSDKSEGGFFFTAEDHEKLLYRPKTMMDETMPSGNGSAARALITLGHLLGESRYLDAAQKTLQAAWPALSQYPAEHCALLMGLKDFLAPPQIIVIRGPDNEIKIWQSIAKSIHNYTFAIPDNAKSLPKLLASQTYAGKTRAYVCEGAQCSAVIEDINALKKMVRASSSR